MPNNLKGLGDAERKAIANSTEICAFIVAAYSLREELMDYVRKATSVAIAKARAKEAKSYADGLITGLGSFVSPTTATVDDAVAAIRAASLDSPDTICQPPLRWDPVTETCV